MIEVITRRDGDTQVSDTYAGGQVSFLTEPSGVLVILARPGHVLAAYAPGEWKKVRDAAEMES